MSSTPNVDRATVHRNSVTFYCDPQQEAQRTALSTGDYFFLIAEFFDIQTAVTARSVCRQWRVLIDQRRQSGTYMPQEWVVRMFQTAYSQRNNRECCPFEIPRSIEPHLGKEENNEILPLLISNLEKLITDGAIPKTSFVHTIFNAAHVLRRIFPGRNLCNVYVRFNNLSITGMNRIRNWALQDLFNHCYQPGHQTLLFPAYLQDNLDPTVAAYTKYVLILNAQSRGDYDTAFSLLEFIPVPEIRIKAFLELLLKEQLSARVLDRWREGVGEGFDNLFKLFDFLSAHAEKSERIPAIQLAILKEAIKRYKALSDIVSLRIGAQKTQAKFGMIKRAVELGHIDWAKKEANQFRSELYTPINDFYIAVKTEDSRIIFDHYGWFLRAHSKLSLDVSYTAVRVEMLQPLLEYCLKHLDDWKQLSCAQNVREELQCPAEILLSAFGFWKNSTHPDLVQDAHKKMDYIHFAMSSIMLKNNDFEGAKKWIERIIDRSEKLRFFSQLIDKLPDAEARAYVATHIAPLSDLTRHMHDHLVKIYIRIQDFNRAAYHNRRSTQAHVCELIDSYARSLRLSV